MQRRSTLRQGGTTELLAAQESLPAVLLVPALEQEALVGDPERYEAAGAPRPELWFPRP